MKHLYLAGLITLALAFPAPAQGKKKDDSKKPGAAETIEAEKLQPGQLAGKILAASESSLQVRVDIVHYEPNQPKGGGAINYGDNALARQAVRDQEYLARLRQNLRMTRNPRHYQHALSHLQHESQRLQQQLQQRAVQQQIQAVSGKNGLQNLFKEVREAVDVNIDLDPNVKVRTGFLPSAFDDMGNIKKWTEAEKKELKGEGADAKLVGYKASASDLKKGALVAVVLAKTKDKEKDAEVKVRGTFVLVLKESDEPVSTGGDAKKKPKK